MPASTLRPVAPATTPDRRATARAGSAWVVLLALGVILLVWLLAWERVGFLRNQAVATEQSRNENLVLAHTETLERQIAAIDQLLLACGTTSPPRAAAWTSAGAPACRPCRRAT